MIAYIKGTVVEKTPQYAVIDVNGVGYRLFITLDSYETLPEPGGRAELHAVTISREDAMHLYGFSNRPEKDMFLKLITVSRIGPKLACSILSGVKPDALQRAIVTRDTASFARIPGIGKKTAERIIMELKDKFEPGVYAAPLTGADLNISDAVAALVNLGYKQPQAQKTVSDVFNKNPGLELGDLIRKSLQQF
ncbi:MAG: Holliday junction ATP-dependent DNA helicase RuvA [bacterium]|nr:MAG: Holliday junction ATP-dependent DNA helicase RuvA [bacterium]